MHGGKLYLVSFKVVRGGLWDLFVCVHSVSCIYTLEILGLLKFSDENVYFSRF